MTEVLVAAVPDLTTSGAGDVLVVLLLTAAAAWPYAHPSDALAAAFAQDEAVAAMHRDFAAIVERTLVLTMRGLVAEVRNP